MLAITNNSTGMPWATSVLVSSPSNAYPYVQPQLTELLALLSFLYLLNVVRSVGDYYLYAGIVAEIALGMVYGAPLAGILSNDWEGTFAALGYLGLIGIVFEGGLSTNLPLLLSNLPLSILCALTGIILPIAFSFLLLTVGYGYKPLEAFAAGAALSSTSLGTTLMVLSHVNRAAASAVSQPTSVRAESKTGLEISYDTALKHCVESVPSASNITDGPTEHQRDASSQILVQTKSLQNQHTAAVTSSPASSFQQTRIATVLISAAVFDDVIGLVLAAMIPALSKIDNKQSSQNLTWTIIRPLLSSFLLAVLTMLVVRFLFRSIFWFKGFGELWCAPYRDGKPWGSRRLFGFGSDNVHSGSSQSGWGAEKHADSIKVFLMICAVSAVSAIAYYIGSSMLFGAYLAGLALSYIARPPESSPVSTAIQAGDIDREIIESSNNTLVEERLDALSFEMTFERTMGPLQMYILSPLFFASIGYAIPFLSLWRPVVFWRGLLYTLLMIVGKLAVGLPIAIWSVLTTRPNRRGSKNHRKSWRRWISFSAHNREQPEASAGSDYRPGDGVADINPHIRQDSNAAVIEMHRVASRSHPIIEVSTPTPPPTPGSVPSLHMRVRSSLAPAMFVGTTMVSRGEIGLLIAQTARAGSSSGTNALLEEEAFLVCNWAILLCTLIGPVGVGFVMRWWGSRVSRGIWR